MKFKYTNYENGVHNIELSSSVEKLKLSDPFEDEVLVSIKMDKSDHQIYLTGDIRYLAQFSCDRCTDEFKAEIECDLNVLYLFNEEEVKEEDENVFYIAPESENIDLSEIVREYAFLSIPLKILCDDDCKGLCPHCGTNLNTGKCKCKAEKPNDVWEKLKELKK